MAHFNSSVSWIHLIPAGLPSGIPGIGELIEGYMQHAPQPGRHSMEGLGFKGFEGFQCFKVSWFHGFSVSVFRSLSGAEAQCFKVSALRSDSYRNRSVWQVSGRWAVVTERSRSKPKRRVSVFNWSIVHLFNCSIVQMFKCSIIQMFNCSIIQLFNYSIVHQSLIPKP